jgi:hypothetical protein
MNGKKADKESEARDRRMQKDEGKGQGEGGKWRETEKELLNPHPPPLLTHSIPTYITVVQYYD